MKQTGKQKNTEKMNESMDAQQKARKAYIENHPTSTNEISKKIVETSFIMSIAERYNNGKPYDFSDIRQFMKFINDFFKVELQGKSNIPQLDLQNIVKFNSYNSITDSYQIVSFSHDFIHDFILGSSKENYKNLDPLSSEPQLIFYYNDDLGNRDHYPFKINFIWDIHLKYISYSTIYSISESFNNDNFFDPEKPLYIAKFMYFIIDLYKKFNSVEFKRIIMKANTEEKISIYRTICCIEWLLTLKSENHIREREFYKTFRDTWTKPYKISWDDFVKYWNENISFDSLDMQINLDGDYKESVSESMDAQKKIQKQKKNRETAETTEQKAKKLVDSIVWKSKIKDLFMQYVPDEKKQDLNDPEIFMQIVNGYLSHYLQTPANMYIEVINEYISPKNGSFESTYSSYYPTQNNLHTFLSNNNFKKYNIIFVFPFNFIRKNIFFKKNFIQTLFKGDAAYNVKIDFKIHLLIENNKLSVIALTLLAGISGNHKISEFTISIPVSDINNSDIIFQVLSYCIKIIKKIVSPEFLAYMLICKNLDDKEKVIIPKTSIIEHYLLISIFMNIDKTGKLRKECIDSEKQLSQLSSDYIQDVKELYQDKLDYARRCFKLCDNEYINGNTQIDESMDARNKLRSKQKIENANAGKEAAHNLFLSKLFLKFAPESKSHDLNDTSVLMDVLTGYMKTLYDSKLWAEHDSNISNDKEFIVIYYIGNPFNLKDIGRMDILNPVFLHGTSSGFKIKFVYEYSADFNRVNFKQLKYISFKITVCSRMPDISLEYDIDQSVKIEERIIGIMKWLREIQMKLLSDKFLAALSTNYILKQKPSGQPVVHLPKCNSLYMAGLELKIFTGLKPENNDSVSISQELFLRAQKEMHYKKDDRFKLLWDNMYTIYKAELTNIRTGKIPGINESIDARNKLKRNQKVDNANVGKNFIDKTVINSIFQKFYPEAVNYDINDEKNILGIIQGYIRKKYHNPDIYLKIDYKESDKNTDSYKNYFRAEDSEDNDITLTKVEALLDKKEEYRLNMIVSVSYSGRYIQSIGLNLFYGTGDYETGRNVNVFQVSFQKDRCIELSHFLEYLNETIDILRSSQFAAFILTYCELYRNESKTDNTYDTNSFMINYLFYSIFMVVMKKDKSKKQEINNVFMFTNDNGIDENDAREKETIMKIYNQQLESVNRQSEINSAVSESMDARNKLRRNQKTEVANAGEKVAHNLFLSKLFLKFAPESKSHDLNDTSVLMDVLTGYMKMLYDNPKLKAEHDSNISNDKEFIVIYYIGNPFNSEDIGRINLVNPSFLYGASSYGTSSIFIIKFVYEYSADFNRENSEQLKYISFKITGRSVMPNISLEYDIDQSVKIEYQIVEIMKWLHEIQMKLLSDKFLAVLSTNYILKQKPSGQSVVLPNCNSLYMAGLELKIFTGLKAEGLKAESNDSVPLEQKLFLRAQKEKYYKINARFKLLWDNMYAIYKQELAKIRTEKNPGISESMDARNKLKRNQKTEDANVGKNFIDKTVINSIFQKFYPEAEKHILDNEKNILGILRGFLRKKMQKPKFDFEFCYTKENNQKRCTWNQHIDDKTGKYEKYFSSYGYTPIINKKLDFLFDKLDCTASMSIGLIHSDEHIEGIELMLQFGCGHYNSKQICIIHISFKKDITVKFYNFIKYLNEVINKCRTPEFAAFLMTYYKLYVNEHKKLDDPSLLKNESGRIYGTQNLMLQIIFYSIFKSSIINNKLYNHFQQLRKIEMRPDNSKDREFIIGIYNQKLEKMNKCLSSTSLIDESMDVRKKLRSKQEFKDNTEDISDRLFLSKLIMKYYPKATSYDLNDVPTLVNLMQGYIQKRFSRKLARLTFIAIISPEDYQSKSYLMEDSNNISDIKKYPDDAVQYAVIHLLNQRTEQELKNLKAFIPNGNEIVVNHLSIWVNVFFKLTKRRITGIRFAVNYEIGNSMNETKIIMDKDIDFINNSNTIIEIFHIIDTLRNDFSSMKFKSLLATTYILQDIGLENIISFSNYHTTAHKVSLYAPAIETFNFMKMGKSEISYEEYGSDADSQTKKGIINFDNVPSATEEMSMGLKIFNSEIARINGKATDTQTVSESINARKKFNRDKKDNSTPEELGKSIALKYTLNKLFDKFAPDVDIKNRNTQNYKSVLELLINFCKEKLNQKCFNTDNDRSFQSIFFNELYEVPSISLFNIISKYKELSNNYTVEFIIVPLFSSDGLLKTVYIIVKFIYKYRRTHSEGNQNEISLSYKIKNEYDSETIINILEFIYGLNEFGTSEKFTALLNVLYLSAKSNYQPVSAPVFPKMSSIYYNKLICDLLKEYDSTGKLQHISDQHQKWIMESKENQLKYEIVYQTYLKQYDKICRKTKKLQGRISESMDAKKKIVRQNSDDKIRNNTHEKICRAALMSLCGNQDVERKTIVEMLEMIIPRIFRKFQDSENKSPKFQSYQTDKNNPYQAYQVQHIWYSIPVIPLISTDKTLENKGKDSASENNRQFTNIKIKSKSNENTVKISLFGKERGSENGILSDLDYTGNNLVIWQYDEGYLYSPDPDNYLTSGMDIDFDIWFNIAGNAPGILSLNEESENMSYSDKYSIIAQFVNDISKSLDFMYSPLMTEGLNQILSIFKDIHTGDLKEREINIKNFFTTFSLFIRKHISNFSSIIYNEKYSEFKYSELKYDSKIQESARKFAEKFYDEHLKDLE